MTLGEAMMQTTIQIQELQMLFHPLGEIRFKSYFSYLGIFKEDTMFALFKEGKLYLRKSEQCLKEIEKTLSSLHFLTDRKIGYHSNLFYLLPYSDWGKMPQFIHWITTAINEFQQIKEKISQENKTKLRFLPNFNLQTERLLNRIDIYTVEEFQQLGAIPTLINLIKEGIDATPLLLYKLYGASIQKYIYLLSEQEKSQLRIKADNALFEAGLRKRFNL